MADIFETDTEDFVLIVWALDSIVGFPDGTAERTRKVYQATVYRQDGEYMDLYDDDWKNFLGWSGESSRLYQMCKRKSVRTQEGEDYGRNN